MPAPPVPANGALVRVAYSLISSGTESVAAAGGGSLLRKALSQPQLAVNAARMALREGLRVTADVVRDVAQDWVGLEILQYLVAVHFRHNYVEQAALRSDDSSGRVQRRLDAGRS